MPVFTQQNNMIGVFHHIPSSANPCLLQYLFRGKLVYVKLTSWRFKVRLAENTLSLRSPQRILLTRNDQQAASDSFICGSESTEIRRRLPGLRLS